MRPNSQQPSLHSLYSTHLPVGLEAKQPKLAIHSVIFSTTERASMMRKRLIPHAMRRAPCSKEQCGPLIRTSAMLSAMLCCGSTGVWEELPSQKRGQTLSTPSFLSTSRKADPSTATSTNKQTPAMLHAVPASSSVPPSGDGQR